MSEFLQSIVRHKPIIDVEYGCPLYGFAANEELGKACCKWWVFVDSFVECWREKFNAYPVRDVVKRARSHWRRYSMTGYEAFVTICDENRRGQ